MKRFIEGEDRNQVTMLPECLDDYVDQDNPVRVVEAFVDQLDLRQMGFEGIDALATGRPSYHPSVLLKIYIYVATNHAVTLCCRLSALSIHLRASAPGYSLLGDINSQRLRHLPADRRHLWMSN